MLSKKKRGVNWQEASHGGVEENSQPSMCAVSKSSSKGLGKRPFEFKPNYETLLPENLDTRCHERSAGKANADVQMFDEANSKPHDIMIYKDGSVTRDRSGWGFTVKQGGRTVLEDNGADRVTTSSLTMVVEAVTHTIYGS